MKKPTITPSVMMLRQHSAAIIPLYPIIPPPLPVSAVRRPFPFPITTCCHSVPHITTRYHMVPHGTTYYHLLPLLPHGTTYYHMLPLLPHGSTWYHTVPHGTTYYHMLPLLPYGSTWYHMLPHVATVTIRFHMVPHVTTRYLCIQYRVIKAIIPCRYFRYLVSRSRLCVQWPQPVPVSSLYGGADRQPCYGGGDGQQQQQKQKISSFSFNPTLFTFCCSEHI